MSNLKYVDRLPPDEEGFTRSDIQIHDDFLSIQSQESVLKFLKAPGWSFGAYSDPAPDASRYWYKHFAGYVKDGGEQKSAEEIESELERRAPILLRMWSIVKERILVDHHLARCYVNGYPYGAEGGLHFDSNIDTHYTALYYPHFHWDPNYSGETAFFNREGTDIIASIYPRPNRLVVFPGVIAHVARGVTRRCPDLRMTLMFKTTGA